LAKICLESETLKVILFQTLTFLFFLHFIVRASIIWKVSFARGIWRTDKLFELAVITDIIVEQGLELNIFETAG